LIVGFQEIFHHLDVSVQNVDDRNDTVTLLTGIKKGRIGPTTPREERDSVMQAYDTVIGNIRDNLSAPPSRLIIVLRDQAAGRTKAIQSQLAPAQTKEP
jgi:hypothetical protein